MTPDIVLLREVAWPDEQATALAEVLQKANGLAYTAHVTGLFATTGWQDGLAIVSRFPLLDFSELQFPHTGKFCQRVRFAAVNRSVDVFNCHLGLLASSLGAVGVEMATGMDR